MPRRDNPLPPAVTHIRIRPTPMPRHCQYHTVPNREAAEVLIETLFKTNPDVPCWAIINPQGKVVRLRTRDPLAQPSDQQRRLF